MSIDQVVQLVVALVGGGAIFKVVEKLLGVYFGSGRSLRDELRGEIARLDGLVKGLEEKVDHLEAEVESWKKVVDEWRVKYYTLLAKYIRVRSKLAHVTGETVPEDEEEGNGKHT